MLIPNSFQDRWHGIIRNKIKKVRPEHDKDKPDVKRELAKKAALLAKRKAGQSDAPAAKKPKIDSWGFINFNPPQPEGEDPESIAEHKRWLKVR